MRSWRGDGAGYVTKSWRATWETGVVAGGRDPGRVLHNGEFGRTPGIANDVFTSSMVLSY